MMAQQSPYVKETAAQLLASLLASPHYESVSENDLAKLAVKTAIFLEQLVLGRLPYDR